MPKRKTEFINGEIYHITARSVDGRPLFMDGEDNWRGIFALYEFNREESVTIRRQREKRAKLKQEIRIKARSIPDAVAARLDQCDDRDKQVEILVFVFMPNHVHLLVRQLKPDGVRVFVSRFCKGYAQYFNARYERMGALFQGRFEAKYVGDNDYLKTLFVYIHTNPVSIISPGWKEKGVEDAAKAKRFLGKYRWSSYLDYLGQNNFPSITNRTFFNKIFKEPETMKEFVDSRIGYKAIYR